MKQTVKWVYVFLALFLFIVRLSYIPNDFVWLDHLDIQEKRAILPLSQIHNAFVQPYGATGFYRPFVTVILSLETYLFSDNASLFHTFQILIHIIISLLAPLFINCFIRITKKEQLVVALIIGVHSISWLSVGALPHLPELLMTIFTLTTLVLYAKQANISLVALSSLLAFFSKETALVLVPALIVLYDVAKQRNTRIPHRRSLFIMPILIGYFIMRFIAVPHMWKISPPALSVSEGIGTRLFGVGQLLYHLIIPFTPSNSDAIQIVQLIEFKAIVLLIVIGGIGAMILKLGIRHKISVFLIMLALSLAPALNIIPLPRFYSINYAYFAVIPLSAMVIVGSRLLLDSKKPVPVITKGVIILWILIMSISTFLAGFKIKNDLALFEDSTEKDPYFREGHFYVGTYFLSKNSMEKAEKHLSKALLDNPAILSYVDKRAARINLAGVYIANNELDTAAILLNQASEGAIGQQKELIDYNRALVAARRGDATTAIIILQPYVASTSNTNLLLLWAEAMVKNQKLNQALTVLKSRIKTANPTEQERINRWIDVHSSLD